MDEGTYAKAEIPCGDVNIQTADTLQCYPLNMKEVFLRCVNGEISIQVQTLLFGIENMEDNRSNLTLLTGLKSIECGDCPSKLL